MSKVADNRRNALDEAREAAEKLTLRRLSDDNFDLHKEKEDWVNNTEGVTEGTPVSQARVINPSEDARQKVGTEAENVSASEAKGQTFNGATTLTGEDKAEAKSSKK